MGTRREEIITYLESSEYTVKDLAALVRSNTRDMIDDLAHVRRSVGKRLRVRSAECTSCDFIFRKRERLSKPSRCPQCKSERIVGPWIHIKKERSPST